MNQKKIGAFLKQLRNEKNLTQEQLAEQFNVSSRTISRWETGSNMPDISIILELSDFYGINVRELLEGERSSMNNALQSEVEKSELEKSELEKNELKETVKKVSEYTNVEKQEKTKKLNKYFCLGTILLIIILLDFQFGLLGLVFVSPIDEFVAGFFTSLAIVLNLVALYNNNHETTLRDTKLAWLSRSKG